MGCFPSKGIKNNDIFKGSHSDLNSQLSNKDEINDSQPFQKPDINTPKIVEEIIKYKSILNKEIEKDFHISQFNDGQIKNGFLIKYENKSEVLHMNVIKKKYISNENDFLKDYYILLRIQNNQIIQVKNIYEDNLNYYIIYKHFEGNLLMKECLLRHKMLNNKIIFKIIENILNILIFLKYNDFKETIISPLNIYCDFNKDTTDVCLLYYNKDYFIHEFKYFEKCIYYKMFYPVINGEPKNYEAKSLFFISYSLIFKNYNNLFKYNTIDSTCLQDLLTKVKTKNISPKIFKFFEMLINYNNEPILTKNNCETLLSILKSIKINETEYINNINVFQEYNFIYKVNILLNLYKKINNLLTELYKEKNNQFILENLDEKKEENNFNNLISDCNNTPLDLIPLFENTLGSSFIRLFVKSLSISKTNDYCSEFFQALKFSLCQQKTQLFNYAQTLTQDTLIFLLKLINNKYTNIIFNNNNEKIYACNIHNILLDSYGLHLQTKNKTNYISQFMNSTIDNFKVNDLLIYADKWYYNPDNFEVCSYIHEQISSSNFPDSLSENVNNSSLI